LSLTFVYQTKLVLDLSYGLLEAVRIY